jgi:hypothetical protein
MGEDMKIRIWIKGSSVQKRPVSRQWSFKFRVGMRVRFGGGKYNKRRMSGAILKLPCIKPRPFWTRVPYVQIFFWLPVPTLEV